MSWGAWDLVRLLELLCGWSLTVQCLEYLRMQQHTREGGVWAWSVQRADIPAGHGLLLRVFDAVFSERGHGLHLILRLLAALWLMLAGAQLLVVVFLFASTLLLLIRWRGAFNGGSDFMTLVVLTGMLLALIVEHVASPELGWSAGLWYIAIHAISSYFMSGWVKLLNAQWRSGEAMVIFLNSGLFGPLPADSVFRQLWLARLCSWSFIGWEALFPLALTHVQTALVFCVIAGIFHFLVFVFFGLNRFFWAWMASFPAILFAAAWKL